MPSADQVLAGRYTLVEPLGSGGMAQVWRGRDGLLGRDVAVKILHPHLRDEPGVIDRFRHEAVLAARVRHPGIVGVYDTIDDDGLLAIVLEFIDGVSLRTHLEQVGRLATKDITALGIDLAEALSAAHRQGLVHRDIKPANVLVDYDGAVRLADFGIAKILADTDMTAPGSVVGTASYLAPEQLDGSIVDERADLYATGLVLYEVATGRLPFTGGDPSARALARLHKDPVDISSVAPWLPDELCDVIMSLLVRDPANRCPSAAELRRRLGLVGDDVDRIAGPHAGRNGATSIGISTGEPSAAEPLPRSVRPPRRRRHTSAGKRSAHRRTTRRRLRPATVVPTLLILGAALLLIAVWTSEPAEVVRPTLVERPGPLRVLGVSSVDPDGTGAAGENEDRVTTVLDGDPATVWTSEGYAERNLGGKRGVGLLLTLAPGSRVDRVDLSSPTLGWAGSVTLPPDVLNMLPPPSDSAITDAPGDVSVSFDGEAADAVLVWITDLGSGPAPYRMVIADVVVIGRT